FGCAGSVASSLWASQLPPQCPCEDLAVRAEREAADRAGLVQGGGGLAGGRVPQADVPGVVAGGGGFAVWGLNGTLSMVRWPGARARTGRRGWPEAQARAIWARS